MNARKQIYWTDGIASFPLINVSKMLTSKKIIKYAMLSTQAYKLFCGGGVGLIPLMNAILK